MAHMMVGDRSRPGFSSHNTAHTDRAEFLGRGQNAALPAALCDEGEQIVPDGASLDPIMALGQDVEIGPRSTLRMAAVTLVASSRAELLSVAKRYQTPATVDRAFHRAHNAAEQELRQLDMPGALLEQIQQLLSLLLYPHATLRAEAAILAANRHGQSGLWGFGISGDHPILLSRLNEEVEGELLQTLLLAHAYWRRRGLKIDLIFLNRLPIPL